MKATTPQGQSTDQVCQQAVNIRAKGCIVA